MFGPAACFSAEPRNAADVARFRASGKGRHVRRIIFYSIMTALLASAAGRRVSFQTSRRSRT
jgi:hypothetical protein